MSVQIPLTWLLIGAVSLWVSGLAVGHAKGDTLLAVPTLEGER